MDWREHIKSRLQKLEQDRAHIRDLDARLAFQNLVSDVDREIFQQAIDSINREIEAIKYELILDEMLQSDLPLDKLNLNRPVIGTSMIINSKPVLIPMELGKDGRWVGKL